MFTKNSILNSFFAATFLLLILNCVLLVQSLNSLISTEDVLRHTFEVRLKVDEVFSMIKDAETGQRGFVITGQESYLEPYNTAISQIDTSIDELLLLNKGNQLQQNRVVIFREKIQRRIERLQQVIKVRRSESFVEAQSYVLTGIGKTEMDDVRSSADEITTEELSLFNQRITDNSQKRLATWITLSITSLVGFGFIVFLFFYIKRDLFVRVKLADNLRVSEELTQATINSLDAHIAVTDEKGSIVVINKAWESFVKENSTEFCRIHEGTIGLSYKEIYQISKNHSEEKLNITIEGISKVLNSEIDQITFEYICDTKSGERCFLVNVTPLKLENSGVVISQTDITQLKNIEKEREKVLQFEIATRTELENLNRTKDEFLATVSHELRTPLNSILGWASMLKAGDFDAETKNKALEVIERNARTQLKLTEDLLDVSRIISGNLRFEIQQINPVEILNSAIEAIKFTANAKHITIIRKFSESSFMLNADPNRLQQIFWNLMFNAIKFTPIGGTLEVCLEKTENFAKFSVCDNGIGISDEFLSIIFDRFQQVDSTTTRKYGGLGLGLAIVKNLVELHGGKATAISEGVNKGSTFVIEIPLINNNN